MTDNHGRGRVGTAAQPPGLLAQWYDAEQEEWLARVDRLAPLIEAHRDRAEHDRVTAPEVMEAVREAGLTRMWVAKEFGGGQVGIATGMAVIEALARLDAAVAWQVAVQGAEGRLSDYLPESVSHRLFHDDPRLVVGVIRPSGRAERVAGGYLLSGEWPFGSGSAHAGWLACGAVVTEQGQPVRTDAGPQLRVLMVPRSVATILDTWHTLGLRGTGSNHYRLSEVFVPDEMTVDRAALRWPPADRPSRAYPVGYFDFGPFAEAPTCLGIARDALDSFAALAGGKVPTSGMTTLAANHVVQDRLGRAENLLYCARVLLYDLARRTALVGDGGGDPLSAVARLTGATVAENTVAAVDLVYELAGSSSMYVSSRMERCFRDIHTATKHISMSWSHFEMVGQYLLGGGLQIRR